MVILRGGAGKGAIELGEGGRTMDAQTQEINKLVEERPEGAGAFHISMKAGLGEL